MKIIEPVASFLVRLPNGFNVSCKDLHSAEMLCAYLNGLEDVAETKNDADNSEEHYNHFVGSLVEQMPPGSSLTHNTSGGWKYRDANGSEYGPYVNVHNALITQDVTISFCQKKEGH